MAKPTTPYYLIDEKKLLRNLKIIQKVRELSGAKSVLALKCFSTWSVFPLMSKYMDGTTSSSLPEAKLGYEKFGKPQQVLAHRHLQRRHRFRLQLHTLWQCCRQCRRLHLRRSRQHPQHRQHHHCQQHQRWRFRRQRHHRYQSQQPC